MPTQALGKQLVMIGSPNGGTDFLVDVSLSEEHTYESEVTEFPVEKGSDVTDNIRRKPIVVSMEGLVSNSPINPDIIAARNAIDESVDEALAHLEKVFESGEPVTIRTSLKTWESMALQNLVIPRGPNGTESLRFTARFVQVDVRTNTRTKQRVATPIAMRPREISSPPKPAPVTGKSFNDSLPLYKVIGIKRFLIFNYLWYDDDIAAWREGVVHDAPRNVHTGDSEPAEGWVLYKEKPFGATNAQWGTVQSDSFWKSLIAASYEANKDSALGNPYDPFGEVHTQVISDVKLVHAMRR
jgi:hypothetical protein